MGMVSWDIELNLVCLSIHSNLISGKSMLDRDKCSVVGMQAQHMQYFKIYSFSFLQQSSKKVIVGFQISIINSRVC